MTVYYKSDNETNDADNTNIIIRCSHEVDS